MDKSKHKLSQVKWNDLPKVRDNLKFMQQPYKPNISKSQWNEIHCGKLNIIRAARETWVSWVGRNARTPSAALFWRCKHTCSTLTMDKTTMAHLIKRMLLHPSTRSNLRFKINLFVCPVRMNCNNYWRAESCERLNDASIHAGNAR
jgi:hypothetical protein